MWVSRDGGDLRKLAAGIVTATRLLRGCAQQRRECAAEHQRRHHERREQLVALARRHLATICMIASFSRPASAASNPTRASFRPSRVASPA
jgi:hypothetical protein